MLVQVLVEDLEVDMKLQVAGASPEFQFVG